MNDLEQFIKYLKDNNQCDHMGEMLAIESNIKTLWWKVDRELLDTINNLKYYEYGRKDKDKIIDLYRINELLELLHNLMSTIGPRG